MKHIFVRPTEPKDAANVIEWSIATPNNEFDPEVIRFPTTYTFCAFDSDGPFIYMPVQQPQMVDALAVKPGTDERKVARGLEELIQATVTQAYIKGSGELYFLDTDPETSKFAGNHMFVELPWKVYRAKLKDLEGNQCTTTQQS